MITLCDMTFSLKHTSRLILNSLESLIFSVFFIFVEF